MVSGAFHWLHSLHVHRVFCLPLCRLTSCAVFIYVCTVASYHWTSLKTTAHPVAVSGRKRPWLWFCSLLVSCFVITTMLSDIRWRTMSFMIRASSLRGNSVSRVLLVSRKNTFWPLWSAVGAIRKFFYLFVYVEIYLNPKRLLFQPMITFRLWYIFSFFWSSSYGIYVCRLGTTQLAELSTQKMVVRAQLILCYFRT